MIISFTALVKKLKIILALSLIHKLLAPFLQLITERFLGSY